MMHEPVYRRRKSVISRGEREWRVTPDALVSIGASGHERRWLWKDIVSVRLCSEPARARPWLYTFELQTKQGAKIEIDNAHCLRRGVYEDRSASYTPFVRAAVARVASGNPKARALIGETPKRYFFLMLVALLALGALAYALIATPTPLDGIAYAAPIKFGIILLMLPLFWRLVLRAMPRGVALDAIPERALPPPGGPA